MSSFCVVKGTPVCAIEFSKIDSMKESDLKMITTKKDNIFFTEDIVLDPLNKFSTIADKHVIFKTWATSGKYGFLSEDKKWLMIVSGRNVAHDEEEISYQEHCVRTNQSKF